MILKYQWSKEQVKRSNKNNKNNSKMKRRKEEEEGIKNPTKKTSITFLLFHTFFMDTKKRFFTASLVCNSEEIVHRAS